MTEINWEFGPCRNFLFSNPSLPKNKPKRQTFEMADNKNLDSIVTYNELLKHWSEKKLERMPYEKLTPRFGHQPVHPMQFKVQELMTSCPVKAAQAGKWVVSPSNIDIFGLKMYWSMLVVPEVLVPNKNKPAQVGAIPKPQK